MKIFLMLLVTVCFWFVMGIGSIIIFGIKWTSKIYRLHTDNHKEIADELIDLATSGFYGICNNDGPRDIARKMSEKTERSFGSMVIKSILKWPETYAMGDARYAEAYEELVKKYGLRSKIEKAS